MRMSRQLRLLDLYARKASPGEGLKAFRQRLRHEARVAFLALKRRQRTTLLGGPWARKEG